MSGSESVIAIAPKTAQEQVSDAELARYAELIYKRTGIRVSPHKKALVSNRLRRRLRQTGITAFEDYYRHLVRLPANAPEWDAFLQEITTHETYLFRDENQWDWLRKVYLPERAAAARAGHVPRSLRIWSAACSTGDEATTVACCIAACLPEFEKWRISILGTDIGTGAIDEARAAVFNDRAIRLVPSEYRDRYFTRVKDALLWRAKPMLTNLMVFRRHNLMEPLREPPFDLVFLKNVLIYFDDASKRQVVANVRAMVRPEGFLVAGAAEGISELVRDFKRHHPWLHQRLKESKG